MWGCRHREALVPHLALCTRAVDAPAARAVRRGDVAPLRHESGRDPMDDAAAVAQPPIALTAATAALAAAAALAALAAAAATQLAVRAQLE